MNFVAKKILEHKLVEEDRKYIVPHFPGGVVTADDLHKIVGICAQFPEIKLKLSGEIIIGGMKEETRNKECRRMLGLATQRIAGFSIRPVKICAGGYLCANNLQDSFSLGIKLDEIFCGRKLPFKMIISISGCSRSCSEPRVKDIGIVANRHGYSIFIGGAAGAKPRIAQKLIDNVKAEEVIAFVERIVKFYEEKGKIPERLGIFVEKMGFDKFKEECGIGKQE